MAEKDNENIPIYSQPGTSVKCDERKFPASYGFESQECAEFPTYIMFDITNVCNSKCIHCPHSTVYSKSNTPVFLKLDVYKKVIDECAGRKIHFVRITADGEPLLHQELIVMINYASKQKVGPVGLTTNGSLLNSSTIKEIVESDLFMIDISLDAAKSTTYEKIRNGLSFEKTINNVKSLLEYKNKIGSPLKVMVSFVKQEDNLSEVEEFENYWKPLVDKVLIREMISNVNLVKIEKGNNVARWPCPHWFRRIVVNYEGVIKACPIDWKNGTAYMHVSETSIYDAWHSDFYQKNRFEHLNNNFSTDSICKDCMDWQGSPWELGYEKVVAGLKGEAS